MSRRIVSAWILLTASAQAAIWLSPVDNGHRWRTIVLTSHWSLDPASQLTPSLLFRYNSGKLLVGATVSDPGTPPQYSSNRYIADLQGGGLHAAKPAEWDAAVPVGTHVDSPFRRAPVKKDQEVMYAGRTFRGRGKFLHGFALSPDGHWLALMSWQGHINGCDDFCIDFSISRGQLFADIFDVSLGKEQTRLEARFLSEEPFETLSSARWISDRHFILATGGAKKLVLCDMRPGEPALAAAWDLAGPSSEILGFWEEPRIYGFGNYLTNLILHTAIRAEASGLYSLKGELVSSNDGIPHNPQFAVPPGNALDNSLLHGWTTAAVGSASAQAGIQSINVLAGPEAPGPYELRNVQLTSAGQSLAVAPSLGPTSEYPLTSSMLSVAQFVERTARNASLPRIGRTGFPPPKLPGVKPSDFTWHLTGEHRVELIDDDHDGKAEFLHLQIGVDTNVRGCVLQATLVGQGGWSQQLLSMRETESVGMFSAYVPGSELYFISLPTSYSIEHLRATCGETATTQAWVAWEGQDVKIPIQPIDPRQFQTPFQLNVRRLPRTAPNHQVEFALDCVPRAPLRFDLEFSASGQYSARFAPSSGPCRPNATRVIVDDADYSFPNDHLDVHATSPGSGLTFRNAELHWTPLGTSPVTGFNPAQGEGPRSRFWISLAGSGGLAKAELLFNDRPDVQGGCHITDFNGPDERTKHLTLDNDDGSGSEVSHETHPQRLENSRCAVEGLRLLNGGFVDVEFKRPFFGPRKIYIRVTGQDGSPTDWQQVGAWTASDELPPEAISVTPYLGSGMKQTFTFVIADPNGTPDIAHARFLIQKFRSDEQACSFDLDPALGSVTLLNDQATAAAGVLRPAEKGTIVNAQCGISNLRLESTSNDSRQVRVDVTFSREFAGRRNIYATVEDRAKQSSGSVWLGSWVVPVQ